MSQIILELRLFKSRLFNSRAKYQALDIRNYIGQLYSILQFVD